MGDPRRDRPVGIFPDSCQYLLHRPEHSSRRRRIHKYEFRLERLKHKAKSYPDKLSGGEQQRVAIARAIANNPKILICDEPTGNLDPTISKEIMDILTKINKELGTTILMVTHDINIVKTYQKRVLVLKEGRLVKDYKEGTYKNEEF